MNTSTPHYLLFSEASRNGDLGCWRFVLQTADGLNQFEAADIEPRIRGERLDLLAVVRGLEALDQPSQVTLLGCSRYVRNGVQYGLSQWRANGWRWEFFGEMVRIKNGDLWQRIDRALRFHKVECRNYRFDPPHNGPLAAVTKKTQNSEKTHALVVRVPAADWVRYRKLAALRRRKRRVAAVLRLWWRHAIWSTGLRRPLTG